MKKEHVTILRFISMLHRNTNRYFDSMLNDDTIGSGQQFFLLRIYENQDITMLDLSRLGAFDKGTVTKAVQKLSEAGYVNVTTDPDDKRVRHLSTTEKALPLINRLYQMRDDWLKNILREVSNEDCEVIFENLKNMANMSSAVMQKIVSEKGEKSE